MKAKLQFQFDDQRCGEFYKAKENFTKAPKGENMFIMWVLRRGSPRCHHKGHHIFLWKLMGSQSLKENV